MFAQSSICPAAQEAQSPRFSLVVDGDLLWRIKSVL